MPDASGARGDLEGAAAVALRGYGREVHNFLFALHERDEDAAAESPGTISSTSSTTTPSKAMPS